jgi:hypothetical protein
MLGCAKRDCGAALGDIPARLAPTSSMANSSGLALASDNGAVAFIKTIAMRKIRKKIAVPEFIRVMIYLPRLFAPES